MKIRKPPRRISSNLAAARPGISSISATVEQSHARQIRELPKYQLDILVNALRENTRPAAIAAYFADQGWLNVSERSFVQYIQAFRRVYPSMCDQADWRDEEHKFDLNAHLDPRQPSVDEEVQLEQLLRVQKTRLAIGLKFERDTGIVNQHLSKDVRVAADIVETLARMRGKVQGAGRPSADSHHPMTTEAKEALRTTEDNERQQARLVGMMDKLGGLLKSRDNVNQNS